MIEWLAARAIRLGIRNWLALILILAILICFANGLEAMVRGVDAWLVLTVGLTALVCGWLVARSPLPSRLAAPFSMLVGIEFILLRVGQLAGQVVAVLLALLALFGDLPTWISRSVIVVGSPGVLRFSVRPLPHQGAPALALFETWNATLTVLSRGRDWIQAIASGRGAFDPVGAALWWSALIWLAFVGMGWSLRRREQAIEAVLPVVVLLAGLVSYTGGPALLLIPVLASWLLLMALVGHNARERRWRLLQIGYSDELRIDLAYAVVPITFVLVLAASILPSFSIQQIVETAQRAVRDRAGDGVQLPNAFGVQPAPQPTTTFDTIASPGLPNSRLIGLSPEDSAVVVMRIKTTDVISTTGGVVGAPRYYWRGSTYDRYTGRGWYSGWNEIADYRAGEAATEPQGAAVRLVRQQVEIVRPISRALYVTGQLIAVDRDYQVARRAKDDLFSASAQTGNYDAESWIVTASEGQLRQAGVNYPDWIVRNYLDLPPSLPSRVLALARDLTATGATAYDRAEAIESYLRQFPYTLDVPMPPPNHDAVDYFLFDLQRGYCDYYASAMVVLARAAGLPARLVVGYASGQYDEDRKEFDVRAGDAHAWPELYFPNYGWVEFEPTAGRASIDRNLEASRVYPRDEGTKPQVTPTRPAGGNAALLLLVLFGVAFAAAGVLALDEWRLRRLRPTVAVRAIYARVLGHARALRVDASEGRTPYQVAAAFDARLGVLALRGQSNEKARRASVDRTAELLRWLTRIYVESRYSRSEPDARTAQKAIDEWSRVRWTLWLARLWQLRQRRK